MALQAIAEAKSASNPHGKNSEFIEVIHRLRIIPLCRTFMQNQKPHL